MRELIKLKLEHKKSNNLIRSIKIDWLSRKDKEKKKNKRKDKHNNKPKDKLQRNKLNNDIRQ